MASRAQIDQQTTMCTVENTEVDPVPHAAGSKEVASCKSAVLFTWLAFSDNWQLSDRYQCRPNLTELVNQKINTRNECSTLHY